MRSLTTVGDRIIHAMAVSEFLEEWKLMAMAMKQKKIRGRMPILELLFPRLIRETRCSSCGRPFLEHPDREPSQRFAEHNVEALIYEQRTAMRKEWRTRIGVWLPVSDGFQFAQLFHEQDLVALRSVVARAIEFVKVEKEVTAERILSGK